MVLWKDESKDWMKLKYTKDSNPVEFADYVVANRIQDNPELDQWCSKVLRRQNIIISKVKYKY